MATFNMMPAQGFWGTNDWVASLTATEGRLVQIAKMNHGFGKVTTTLFGEAGMAAVRGMSLPDWWMAGDARVAQATMMRGGRGLVRIFGGHHPRPIPLRSALFFHEGRARFL
jgi:hypothetical protein